MLGRGTVFALRVSSKACGAHLETLLWDSDCAHEAAELILWGQELSEILNHQRGPGRNLAR